MTRKLIYLILIYIFVVYTSYAGNRIKVYFNKPVDVSVSTGVNAVYLNSCMADTLVAYINRSKYTLDIAVYSYTQGSYANIATAVNNAYSRGVRVRWIYDSSMSNTGVALLNPAINTLSHPTTTGIMHCKFAIIDGRSSDPDDAFVWTGSPNWTTNNFNTDFNNIVIVQDSGLAHAYLGQFNHMWGDTGLAPNVTLSKFGPAKGDLGRHLFTVDGNLVEVYFSPSDSTNNKIQATINTANKDLYFAMYAFTHNANASLIMSRHSGGVYVAGINDNFQPFLWPIHDIYIRPRQ
jgi:phosphatidylserine/phosphatidylglycerophosphate/cardiolipin synthase-like enzyme